MSALSITSLTVQESELVIIETEPKDQIEKLREQLKPFEEGLAKYGYSLKDLPALDLGEREITSYDILPAEMGNNRVMIAKEKCNRAALAFLVHHKKKPEETGILFIYKQYANEETGINRGWKLVPNSLRGHHQTAKHDPYSSDVACYCDSCPFLHSGFTQTFGSMYIYPDPFLDSLFKDKDYFYQLNRPSSSWFSRLKFWK